MLKYSFEFELVLFIMIKASDEEEIKLVTLMCETVSLLISWRTFALEKVKINFIKETLT